MSKSKVDAAARFLLNVNIGFCDDLGDIWKAAKVLVNRIDHLEKCLDDHWKHPHGDEPDYYSQRLARAARAVLDRWDSPDWKDVEPTAKIMNDLRAALEFRPRDSAD